MPTPWKHTLNISHVWKNPNMELAERARTIARHIRNARFYHEADDPELESLTEELSDAVSVAEFDAAWDELYDWFDANRVWVRL